MAIFLKFVSLLCVGLFVLSVFLTIKNWKKAKILKPDKIVKGQFIALISTIVFTYFCKSNLETVDWLLLFFLGFMIGAFYSKFIKVQFSEQGVVMNYTLPYIITWCVLLAVTQLLTILTGRVPTVTLGLSILNLGINIAVNSKVLHDFNEDKKLKGVAK